jgi:hypothetical protein
VIFQKIFPIEERLKLKLGAQVMFVKMICQWTRIISTENGSKNLSSQEILVHFPEQNDRSRKYEWQNIRYKIDPATKEIEEEVLGTLSITPIKLAWQLRCIKPGIDFDKAAIDVSQVLCQVRLMLHYRVCAR